MYEDLLNRNPENVMYYQKLIEAKQLSDPDEKVAFFEIYKWVFNVLNLPKWWIYYIFFNMCYRLSAVF